MSIFRDMLKLTDGTDPKSVAEMRADSSPAVPYNYYIAIIA